MIKVIEICNDDLPLVEADALITDNQVIFNEDIYQRLIDSGVTCRIESYSGVMLIDLNMTLAEKCKFNWKDGTYYVNEDVYSAELAKYIKEKDALVIIITARGGEYKEETLSKIKLDLPDFNIDGFECKPFKRMKVSNFKRDFAKKILGRGLSAKDIFAIESNAETAREYKKIGIVSRRRNEVLCNG